MLFLSLQINSEAEKLSKTADEKIGHGAGQHTLACKLLLYLFKGFVQCSMGMSPFSSLHEEHPDTCPDKRKCSGYDGASGETP